MDDRRRHDQPVLRFHEPRDDFDVFLQAQQRRVLRAAAHYLAVAKLRWRRQAEEAQCWDMGTEDDPL